MARLGNLTHVRGRIRYRIETWDGAVIEGDLLEVSVRGVLTVQLDDGSVLDIPYERTRALTKLEPL